MIVAEVRVARCPAAPLCDLCQQAGGSSGSRGPAPPRLGLGVSPALPLPALVSSAGSPAHPARRVPCLGSHRQDANSKAHTDLCQLRARICALTSFKLNQGKIIRIKRAQTPAF